MIRLIGILTGSAIAIATLIIAVGIPTLTSPGSGSVSEPGRSGSVSQLAAPLQPVDSASTDVTAGPDMVSVTDPEPDSLVTDPEPGDAVLVEQVFAPEESRDITMPGPQGSAVEDNWHAFWSPFRSEIAANGFISRLQETTGLDYRVVKVETGESFVAGEARRHGMRGIGS